MIPSYYQRVAEQIHQERIQGAMRPRPEWEYASLQTRPGRPSLLARLRARLLPRVGSRQPASANARRSSGAPRLSSNV
jgi:hypothetical protein